MQSPTSAKRLTKESSTQSSYAMNVRVQPHHWLGHVFSAVTDTYRHIHCDLALY